jgi:hypothetical protein
MLIGHLPAGYLIGRALTRQPSANATPPVAPLAADRLLAIMAGSVFPDVDMIYFYLFDHQRTHHHLYWTHLPSFWLMVCAGILLAWVVRINPRPPVALWFFLAGVLSHLLLDSIIGDIYWLIPFSYQPFSLFTVHPRYSPWYLNFVMHWVFGLELVLTSCAVAFAYRDMRRVRNLQT